MMVRTIGLIAGIIALGGCTTGAGVGPQAGVPSKPQIRSVTYATTPCHGTCPVYTVTLAADGAGVFTGTSNTATLGERRFKATPAQVGDFFTRLQPYLPEGERLLTGPDGCRMYASDLPSADVRWTDGSRSGHLLYDYGCDRETHRAMADALRAAPQALPIAALIGNR